MYHCMVIIAPTVTATRIHLFPAFGIIRHWCPLMMLLILVYEPLWVRFSPTAKLLTMSPRTYLDVRNRNGWVEGSSFRINVVTNILALSINAGQLCTFYCLYYMSSYLFSWYVKDFLTVILGILFDFKQIMTISFHFLSLLVT